MTNKPKEGWEEEFEKFWLELSDTRKWIDGKPVVNGYKYVTTGNAIMDFIKNLLLQQRKETQREIIKWMIEEFDVELEAWMAVHEEKQRTFQTKELVEHMKKAFTKLNELKGGEEK